MRSTRILAAAAVVVSAVTLSACSSSSSGGANAPAVAAPTTAAPTTTAPATTGTIVAVASSNPDFSTLVAAVKAAGLVETLSGPGPFTVFAPTNEAFAALPKGLLNKLLLPANKDALTKILTYHVLPAKVMAADVTAGKVKTVEGREITVATSGGVMVDKAKVIKTDIAASNGVIHVIDKVLVPADVDVSKL